MTIKKRLYISFALILSIIIFIISIFFYTIYNFNEIHHTQNHRYNQLLRVEKLKESNHAFSWIVLDIITDYEKIAVVENRIDKSKKLFESLLSQKKNLLKMQNQRKRLQI